MARNQSIVRLKGSIDGVTYTEGVNGKLSKSRTTLTKEKMDANPNFHVLRLVQEELGAYSRYGALLRDGVRSELARIKPLRCVQRLNRLLNAIKNEDLVHRMGERTVASGLQSPRGINMLMDFDFYGRTKVTSLLQKNFSIDLASGEATLTRFNPVLDLIAPEVATHVIFKSFYIGIDSDEGLVSTTKSEAVNLPLTDVTADLVLQTDGIPTTAANVFYVVQVLFALETNGFQEVVGKESAALTVVEIAV